MDPLTPLSIEPLASRIASAPAMRTPNAAQADGFAVALRHAVESTSQAQVDASRLAARFQAGDPAVGLEQSMIALQSASLQFQALVQTRNRLVQAYQDIMNMPV